MVLNTSHVEIFIDKGLDESIDEKLSQGFGDLTNVVWRSDGTASKRWGTQVLTTSSLDASAVPFWLPSNDPVDFTDHITSLGTRDSLEGSQLIAFCSSSVWSYDSSVDSFVSKGPSKRCSLSSHPHPRTTSGVVSISEAVVGDIRVTACMTVSYVTGTAAYQPTVSVSSVSTGQFLIAHRNLGEPTPEFYGAPKAVAITSNNPDDGDLYQKTRIFVFFAAAAILVPITTPRTLYVYHLIIDPERPFDVDSDAYSVVNFNTAGTDVHGTLYYSASGDFDEPSTGASYAKRGLVGNTFDVCAWESETFGNVILRAASSGSGVWLSPITINAEPVPFAAVFLTGSTGIHDILGLAATPHAVQVAVLASSSIDPPQSASIRVRDIVVSQSLNEFSGTQYDALYEKRNLSLIMPGLAWGKETNTLSAAAIASSSNQDTHQFDWYLNWIGGLSTAHLPASTSADRLIEIDNKAYSFVSQHPVINGFYNASSGSHFVSLCSMVAKPFQHATRNDLGSLATSSFFCMSHVSREQGVGFLSDASGSLWGTFNKDFAYAPMGTLPAVVSLGSGAFECPTVTWDRTFISGSEPRSSIDLLQIDFDPAADSPNTSLAGTNINSQGYTKYFDGVSNVELGFHLYPMLKQRTGSDSDMIVMTNLYWTTESNDRGPGIYRYFATYHWWDAVGKEHRSNPGPGVVVEVDDGYYMDYVIIRFYPPPFTDKNNVIIKLWRTVANGGVPYFLSSEPRYQFSNNIDWQTNQLFYVDRIDNEDLLDNEPLYSISELPNDSPPQSSMSIEWDNRLWLVDESDGLTLWFSKSIVAGLAPEMSGYQTVTIDQAGGRITALVNLDDKLIVFKKNRIYVVFGTGPDATGAGSTYTAQLVSTHVGCTSKRAVGTISSLGVVFAAVQGIYLLDRSLNTLFIGQQVHDTFAGKEVVSIVHDILQNLINVVCRDGTQIVYDIHRQRWATHVFDDRMFATSSSTTHELSDAISCNDVLMFAGRDVSSGSLGSRVAFIESGTFTDNGEAYPMSITTPWIHLAGVQGFQRVKRIRLLGKLKSDHNFRLTIEHDYNDRPEFTQVVTGTMSSYVNATSGTLDQLQFYVNHQKCQAIRLTFADEEQTGSMESFELTGINLDVGVKAGASFIPDGKRP